MTERDRYEEVYDSPMEHQVVRQEVIETPAGREVVQHNIVVPGEGQQRLATLVRIKQAIYFVASLIAVVILFRFVLLMLGANQANGFANFIYSVSYPLVAPFLGLFGQEPQYGQSVFEISSLIAIAVYYLVAWIISKVISLAYAPADPTGRSY